MCIILLIFYGLYCLFVDLVNWIGRSIANRNKKSTFTIKKSKQKNEPITMNELLTFEELLEDDDEK